MSSLLRFTLENGHATDRLKRVPTGELKAVAIRDVIAKPVHSVFGNSMHDHAMLAIAEQRILHQSQSRLGASRNTEALDHLLATGNPQVTRLWSCR